MVDKWQIFIPLLLVSVTFCDQSSLGTASFVHKIQGNEFTVSARASVRDPSRKIACPEQSEEPNLLRVWYGLDFLGNFSTRCADVPGQDRWTDLTAAMRKNCKRGEANNVSCALPNIGQGVDYGAVNEKIDFKYWLICYSCNSTKPQKRNSGDGFDFYPRKSSSSQTLLTRRQKAMAMARDTLLPFLKRLEGRQGRQKHKESMEEFLRRAEVTAGKMTQILLENESMDLAVDMVGNFTLLRKKETTVQKSAVNIWENSKVDVVLPDQSNLRNSDDQSLVAAIIRYDPKISDLLSADSNRNLSEIISVAVFNSTGAILQSRQLSEDIQFRLAHPAATSNRERAASCVFWDFEESDWSSAGCVVVESNASSTLCSCSHLTNFAVILDIIPFDNSEVLRILTLVGCSLSALGLLGSLVFFLQHRGNDLNDRIRINTHFCLNLLIVQLLMIFGIDQAELPALCKTSSVLLHYFLLATFTWSLLSGHQIYVLLVQVFDTEQQKMRGYFFAGYGLPAALVAMALVVDAAWLQGITYGNAEYCWMQPNVIYHLFFMLPLTMILAFNLGMLSLVLFKVFRIEPRPHMASQARGWFSLALLLGGTWMVGVLGKLFPSMVSAVVFIVLNSLQGLLIFIFHVLLGQRCQSRIRRELDSRIRSSDTPSKGGLSTTY